MDLIISSTVILHRLLVNAAHFDGLFASHSTARLPDSCKQRSTLGTKMDDAKGRMFFFFPHCQHVLSQIWRGFSHVGIQRCAALLIRLLCHAPLHLSWADCSRQRKRQTEEGWRVRRGTAPPAIPAQSAPDFQRTRVKSWASVMASKSKADEI